MADSEDRLMSVADVAKLLGVTEPTIRKDLSALQEHCERVTVLGSFPQAPLSND